MRSGPRGATRPRAGVSTATRWLARFLLLTNPESARLIPHVGPSTFRGTRADRPRQSSAFALLQALECATTALVASLLLP
jgi:hypothetical protein